MDIEEKEKTAKNIRQEEEEKIADNTQQEQPSNNNGGAEGGAELALDPNNNQREGSQLGARRKVEIHCENCNLILIYVSH